MPSLAEIIAAKKAAAAQDVKPLPDAPQHGLRLTSQPKPEPEPPGGLKSVSWMQGGRRLGFTDDGEQLGSGGDPQWINISHSLATDLCIVVAEGYKDEAWLAVWPAGENNRPLLIHRLPLRFTDGAKLPF